MKGKIELDKFSSMSPKFCIIEYREKISENVYTKTLKIPIRNEDQEFAYINVGAESEFEVEAGLARIVFIQPETKLLLELNKNK